MSDRKDEGSVYEGGCIIMSSRKEEGTVYEGDIRPALCEMGKKSLNLYWWVPPLSSATMCHAIFKCPCHVHD
jgi:hypothetical protein